MSKTINIQVTIDAVGVVNSYPNPSKDQHNPTGIGHNFGYMVATSNTISGSGTGDLNFSANVGDTVRFFGVSASDNFEDSILIYNITKYQGTNVFSEFHSQTFTKKGVSPSGPEVLPAKIANQAFWFFEADVINAGTEGYRVVFALYTRDTNGYPTLYGYFQWDPTITVNG
ncbi:inclusion body family protein [Aureispira anguillae]|uniref:Inclusion body family protein n=1 Tax=Aureispira anguillae TaxID=2864201 RepID=A0A915YHX5_9BACT|nr:inclusion body family protein [Aureispira anguillae]BDS13388.1 inclusion body family protein [Aureispira anguillae]